jgi:ABC-2 type transport system ATP-binding protein
MLASLRGRTTVFFSTHILSDVERICDTVAILDAGKVVAHGSLDDLKSRYGAEKVVVEVDDGAEWLAEEVRRAPWASAVTVGEDGALEISVSDAAAARRALPVLIASRGLGLRRMEAGDVDLEEVFVGLVGGGRS